MAQKPVTTVMIWTLMIQANLAHAAGGSLSEDTKFRIVSIISLLGAGFLAIRAHRHMRKD